MAIGKEAPVPDICITSAACRQALEATVAKFSEAIEEVTPATLRRRIKKSKRVFDGSETVTVKLDR